MRRLLKFTAIGCGGLLGLLILVGIVGAIIGPSEQAESPTPGEEVAPVPGVDEEPVAEQADPAAQEDPEPEPEPEPITLSGTGQQATEAFELEAGLVIATLSHQGQGHFGVTLLDETGQMADLFANAIGPFDGSTAYGAAGGTYLLDVQADGPWTVTIEQPRPADAPETRSFQGQGPTASEPFSLPRGLARFQLSHTGQHHFGVTLLDSDGNMVDLLANDIGSFEGSKAVGVPQDGAYVLDVQADGPWSIEVE
jgi:hypothetical protein